MFKLKLLDLFWFKSWSASWKLKFLVKIPFFWKLVHFRPAFHKTLWTISSLMDGGMSAFTITLFTKKFPISSCKCLVCCKMFLFCRTDSFWVFSNYFSKTTKSPIFFFICLQVVAFEYYSIVVWSYLWYFWISFSCILMQTAPVNGYIQWNSLFIYLSNFI